MSVGLRDGASPDDFRAVAATARRALGCGCVIVTASPGSGEPCIVATDGVGEVELRRAWPALRSVDRRVNEGPCQRATVRGEALDELGYGLHVLAPLVVDGQRLGALHALHRDAGARVDRALLEAFAGHCAIALAHQQLRKRAITLAERAEQTDALDRLVLRCETPADLVPHIDGVMEGVFGPVRSGITIWDEQRSVLKLLRGSFGGPVRVTDSFQVARGELRSNAARVFGMGRPNMSNHASGDPGIMQEYVAAFGIERLISVPLVVGDRPTGVLHLANKATDFTMADVQRCQELMPRIAIAVESTMMHSRLRIQQRLETVLSDVAVAMASGTMDESRLRAGLDDLRALYQAGIVALLPTDAEALIARGPHVSVADEQRLLNEPHRQEGERAQAMRPSGAGEPGWATVHVPVRIGSRRIATLAAYRGRNESFTADERRGLARMANLIALLRASERDQHQRATLARLEERQRIAEDLHDDLAQLLFAAQIQLDGLLDLDQIGAETRTRAEHARRLLIRGDGVIREVIGQLTEPAPGGVASRLSDVVRVVREEFRLEAQIEITPAGAAATRSLEAAVADPLVKVAREALVNVAKHAGSCRVRLTLDRTEPGELQLRVRDDGVGIDPVAMESPQGLGSLRRSVTAAGGQLQVNREASGGTTVLATFPA